MTPSIDPPERSSDEAIQADSARFQQRPIEAPRPDAVSTSAVVQAFDHSPLLDRDLVERRSIPYWSLFFLILAAVSMGLFSIDWAGAFVGASACVAFALVASLRYFRRGRFRVTPDAFASVRPRMTIPFEEIREVVPGNPDKNGNFPVHIILATGSLTVPLLESCNCNELLALLRSRVKPFADSRRVPAAFESFLKQQRLIHSPEQIHIFYGKIRPLRAKVSTLPLQFTLAFLVPIPLWIALANAFPRKEAFTVMSVVFGVAAAISALFEVAVYFSAKQRVKNADDAVLIVTPGGLALNQGDLRGELRWSEVQKISLNSRVSNFGDFQLIETSGGLYLGIVGAQIVVADVYDWPVDALYPLAKTYSGR